ncbi:MAG: hypothetical protein JXR53_02540 [Bacteroidales bacterium]|nr:hypothetical protein [Bacteroidales bacterium]
MINSIKHIVFAAVSIIFFSMCNPKQETEVNNNNDYQPHFPNFKEENTGLGNILDSTYDTLLIDVGFTDCGKWGGHSEKILLFRNQENRLFANLIVDTVCCCNIKSFGNYSALDPEKAVVVIDTVIALDWKDEALFNLFIHRVLELQLNNAAFSNQEKKDIIPEEKDIIIIISDAGSWIHIHNKDKSFNIEFRNWDNMSDTWFGIIRREVFGDILREAGRMRTWYR